MDLTATLSEQIAALSRIEAVAVVAAILYLLLAIRRNIWCWLFAGISTALYIYLMASARLYMESVLNVYYFAMAIYGWWVWRGGSTAADDVPVVSWPFTIHGPAILGIVVLTAINGFVLQTYTDAAYPYVDSMTTWAAIWATFLIARKVLENWWYWLVIDAVSVVIYWERGLTLTSILFVVYLAMIPFGLVAWTRSMHEAKPAPA